jgi:hypothetical protein
MDEKQPDILMSLTDEELAKVSPLSDETIDTALEKGREERLAAEACEPPSLCNSRVLFR